MKLKYFVYFLISVLLTIFDVFPRIINLFGYQENGLIVLFLMILAFSSWILGPVLSLVFFVAWLKEFRKAKNNPILSNVPPDITLENTSSESFSAQVIPSKKPFIRKSLLYTMYTIVTVFIVLGFFVSEKTDVVETSSSLPGIWVGFILVLPFIIIMSIAIAIVVGLVYGIKQLVSKK